MSDGMLNLNRFLVSQNTTRDKAYFDAVAESKELGRTKGIDAALKLFKLDALVLPTDFAATPAAIAGYPLVTGQHHTFSLLPFVSSLVVVPLGFLPPETPLSAAEPTRPAGPNMPFGLSFMGTAFSEFKLISFAYAYEQATLTRLKKRAFSAAVPKTQLKDVVRR